MGQKKKNQNVGKAPATAGQSDQQADANATAFVDHGGMETYDFALEGIDTKDLNLYTPFQRDEFVVAHSIYSDTFERVTGFREPWKKHDNLAFAFTLRSESDADINVRLQFEFPSNYPKVPVKVKILSLQPRQEGLEGRINAILTTFPQQHLDQEVVAEIAELVQTCIDEAARAEESNTAGMSLEEERAHREEVARRHVQAERELSLRQREEDSFAREEETKRALLRFRHRRHEIYKNSKAMPGDEHDPTYQSDEADVEDELAIDETPFRFEHRIEIDDPEAKKKILFKSVLRTVVLLERTDKLVTIARPLLFGKLRRPVFLLKEIYLPEAIASKGLLENAINEIARTLKACQTKLHPHVVRIYAFEIGYDDSDLERKEWKITILSEYSEIGQIGRTMRASCCFSPAKVRVYSQQILQALEFLEKQGYTHPALHAGNALLFESPDGEIKIKVADGYGTTLRELVRAAREHHGIPFPQKAIGWTPPELSKDGPGRSNKTCIWELGILIMEMTFGEGYRLTEVHTSPEKVMYRDDLDEPWKILMQLAFQPVMRRRPTPLEMMSQQFFKDGSKAINIPTPENPDAIPHLFRSGSITTGRSSWINKWDVFGKIGTGGFGQVWKARNLDDGQFYAVKRLYCATAKDLGEIWKEVRLIAKLNHPFVVRYNHAWHEEDIKDEGVLFKPSTPNAVVARAVPAPLVDPSDLPSTGHDFMDPSLPRRIGPEYDSSDDDDDNMFGYQSPPSDDEEEDDEDFSGANPFAIDDNQEDLFQLESNDRQESDDVQFEDSKQADETIPSDGAEVLASSPRQRRNDRTLPDKATLYIQMELCETGTLAELIEQGLPYQPNEVWRLFRKILEGLDHIHRHGVVHRDLKPANIFVDAAQNPKIGDFGLAITGQNDHVARPGHGHFNVGASSRGIGTMYYTAPELESAGSGDYSNKADIFSMGVIFFQMCFPMRTDVEKYGYLKGISENTNYQLPEYFDQNEYRVQKRVIKSMISHDQNARPTAKELLEDDDIPIRVEDSELKIYLNRLQKYNPEEYEALIGRAFAKGSSITKVQDLAWHPQKRLPSDQRMNKFLNSWSNDQLKRIFIRHGAVDSMRQVPFPVAKFYSNAATYMAGSGVVVQLPFDLTMPFARIIAQEHPEESKHFCFGTVFRQFQNSVQPWQIPEVDFDIVSRSARDLSLKDAQLIKVLDDCLTCHPAMRSRDFTIVVNHNDLLDHVLSFCKIPKEYWQDVKRHLTRLNVEEVRWKRIADELQSSRYYIHLSSVIELQRFDMQGSFEQIREKVNNIFGEEHAAKAVRTFKRIEEILMYVSRLGVKTKVEFSPLSNNSEQLFQGSTMFKVMDNRSERVIAAGGRYDRLVEYYQIDTEAGSTRAAGFRFNGLILNHYAQSEYQKHIFSKTSKKPLRDWAPSIPSRLDVVVTSFDEATLQGNCLEIVSSLLACGIKAELSELFDSMDALENAYKDLYHYWVVIVRPGSYHRSVKVRSPSKEERDVRPLELVSHMQSEINERAPMSTSAPLPTLKKMPSSHGPDRSSAQVTILTPEHRGKKVNRTAIVDTVTAAARELAESIGNDSPIIAIDTSDKTLQLMRNTTLTDDATWRNLGHAAGLNERQYLKTLQEHLEGLMSSGSQGAFIANYKSGTCIYYDFGKQN